MTTSDLHPSPLGGLRLLFTLASAIGASIAGSLVTVRVLHVIAPTWASDSDHLGAVIVALVYLCVTAALLVLLGGSPQQRRDWLVLRPVAPQQLWTSSLVWVGAYAAAAVVYTLTAPLGITPGDAAEILWAVGADNGRLHDAGPLLVAVILVRICVIVPVAEELLFRGGLFTWLRRRLAPTWTIAITAAGFALIHQAPAMLPLAFLVGLAAGAVRERTNSVTAPIILHAIQNMVIVALSYGATGWQPSFSFGA